MAMNARRLPGSNLTIPLRQDDHRLGLCARRPTLSFRPTILAIQGERLTILQPTFPIPARTAFAGVRRHG